MTVLTSNGLSGRNLLETVRAHISVGRAALVVTADHEYKEKNYHVARLSKELQTLGLDVECFDFDHRSPAELMPYDVVELIGGNPYYLLDSIRKHHFSDALLHLAKYKCVIGCSAGAIVLTPSLDLIHVYSPELNVVGLKDLSACHVTNLQILPHYNKFVKRYDGFEEKCLQYERINHCSVVRLNDGEGVIV